MSQYLCPDMSYSVTPSKLSKPVKTVRIQLPVKLYERGFGVYKGAMENIFLSTNNTFPEDCNDVKMR